ncbi:3'-5' exonuclease [Vitreoscilla massiliensis]|uniref:3'-5' exonuclease n=1 Tax=Vitreoscilla massiliensis TaxID=1689272 RepID=A0ABY4E8Z2_9NEIS|nr:3'-5' exonuclease [Vitreoscilla massiliensis]UOO89892.1 3'-5' exonuclease [Vitreoscilla massiliensis]
MTPILAFDIETIPDAHAIRTLHEFPHEIADADVVEYALQKRRAQNGSEFLPLHLHRVVAISCCLRWSQDKVHVSTIGSIDDDEATVLRKFYELIERYTPQLVSWNGGGFDLPVMHYRSLIHGISAARYWDLGDGDFGDSRDFKWNNYISRYQMRHCDLMDVLAMYNGRANAPLDQMAKLCGFPGKMGMDGSKVWSAYQDGQLQDIRDYCETDAANTYLMFLRFQLLRGVFNPTEYQAEVDRLYHHLNAQPQAHWQQFCQLWQR